MIKILRLLPILLLVACSGSLYNTPGGEVSGPDAAAAAKVIADYKLGPGDQVRINVFNELDLSGDFTVSTQGTIAMPLAGELPAAGMTAPEFAESLTARLRQGLVKEPRVTAQIILYRPFYILGEVTKPGTYPYSATMTVLNAVATAGGFTYRANTRRVFIKHSYETQEREYPITAATVVQPGDTVRIGERMF